MTIVYAIMEEFMIQMGAGEFKAKCLKLIDLIEQKHETIIITKRDIPIAKLIPYSESPSSFFGFMKNSIKIKGTII